MAGTIGCDVISSFGAGVASFYIGKRLTGSTAIAAGVAAGIDKVNKDFGKKAINEVCNDAWEDYMHSVARQYETYGGGRAPWEMSIYKPPGPIVNNPLINPYQPYFAGAGWSYGPGGAGSISVGGGSFHLFRDKSSVFINNVELEPAGIDMTNDADTTSNNPNAMSTAQLADLLISEFGEPSRDDDRRPCPTCSIP